jgi:cytoskeletal protein CcmA (bactofilin family)
MTDIHNDVVEDEDFDTILSSDIDFSGTINFEKPFLIRGRVSGKIAAKSLLVVDETAVVDADINAAAVIIRGSVRGNITVSEKLEITTTGKLTGNVNTPEFLMENGCIFNGRCTMTDRKPLEQMV